jgi:HEAT repeat protein
MHKAAALLGSVVLAFSSACRSREPTPDLSRLLAELKSPDAEKSGRARLQIITLGEPAVPALAEMLRGGEPRERIIAATTLWGMGARGKAAVPDLSAAAAEADPELRVAVAMALESMGPAAEGAVPALVRALGDRDPRVRQAAVKALGGIGPAARAALPALNRVLKRGSWPEAEEAVRRIRGAAPAPPAAAGTGEASPGGAEPSKGGEH